MFYTRLGLDVPESNIKSPTNVKPNSIFVETGMYADPLLTGKSPSPPGGAENILYTLGEESQTKKSDEK
jgi:hypothetical protein